MVEATVVVATVVVKIVVDEVVAAVVSSIKLTLRIFKSILKIFFSGLDGQTLSTIDRACFQENCPRLIFEKLKIFPKSSKALRSPLSPFALFSS